jgi:hypothetical protein
LICRFLGECDAFWGDSVKRRCRTQSVLLRRCILL